MTYFLIFVGAVVVLIILSKWFGSSDSRASSGSSSGSTGSTGSTANTSFLSDEMRERQKKFDEQVRVQNQQTFDRQMKDAHKRSSEFQTRSHKQFQDFTRRNRPH